MLENLKIKLLKIAKDSEKYNLCRENTGSFSIRDESSGYVIITPSKVKVEDLNIDSICVVDLGGNKIKVIDGIEPDSDMHMHLEVYKARKDIKAIMHINSVYASIFASCNKVIPPISHDCANYGGYIYVASDINVKDTEYARDLIGKLHLSDACLFESNGAIVVSNDIEDVLSKARYVERVAEIYYKALILNQFREPKRFTRNELTEYLKNK